MKRISRKYSQAKSLRATKHLRSEYSAHHEIEYSPKQIISGTGSIKCFGGTLELNDISDQLEPWQNGIRVVKGDVIISNSNIAFFPNLEAITGNLILRNSQIKFFDGLGQIGGSLILENSEILSLNHLEKVGKNIKMKNSKILWASNLEEVCGNVVLDDVYISRVQALKQIGGTVEMHGTEIDWCSEILQQKLLEKNTEKGREDDL